MNLISYNAYGSWCVKALLLLIIIIPAAMYIFQRKGCIISSDKFLLLLLAVTVIPLLVVPLWLTPMSISDKFIGTILMMGGGSLNYYALGRLQKRIMNKKARQNNEINKDQ